MFKKGNKVYLNPKAKFNLTKLQKYQKDYPDEIWIIEQCSDGYEGCTIYHPEAGSAYGVDKSKLLLANELSLIKIESQVF